MSIGHSESGRLGPDYGPGSNESAESGLIAISTLLAMHRIAVDPAQLRHELGHSSPVSAQDLLRLANRLDGVTSVKVV